MISIDSLLCLIAYFLLLIYTSLRFYITIKKRARIYVREYPSRFYFRLISLIRVIGMIIVYILNISEVITQKQMKIIPPIQYIFGDFAFIILVKSVQEFSEIQNNKGSFVNKFYFNIVIPLFISLITIQGGIIYSSIMKATLSNFVFRIVYHIMLILSNILLVLVPASRVIRDVNFTDVEGNQNFKRQILHLVLIIEIIIACILQCVEASGFHPDGYKLFTAVALRELMFIMVSNSQDIIDLIITWTIPEAETDLSKIESMNLGLIV